MFVCTKHEELLLLPAFMHHSVSNLLNPWFIVEYGDPNFVVTECVMSHILAQAIERVIIKKT